MPQLLGLDIGTSSIKLVGVDKKGTGLELSVVSIASNPVGQVFVPPGERPQLAEAIKKLVAAAKPDTPRVRLGLPEPHAFTRLLTLPALSKAELASAIRWEAEQHVPTPMAETQLDYTVVTPPAGDRGQMEVLIVAAKKEAVNQLVDTATLAGLEVVGLETNILAMLRALADPADPPTLITNLGASSTDFCVEAAGKIVFTYAVPTGGNALTRAIEQGLGLAISQAEQYKRTYGLEPGQLEGKVKQAMAPAFDSIMAEAHKAINSFESTHQGQRITRVLVAGGGALMPNVAAEITETLKVDEVVVADPFSGMQPKTGLTLPTERPAYVVATGLAQGKGG